MKVKINSDQKDRWVRGICIGILANSITISVWVPLFSELEPGASYRHIWGLFVSALVIPPTLLYALYLVFRRTGYVRLKVVAILLNMLPLVLIIVIIKILEVMGHLPSE